MLEAAIVSFFVDKLESLPVTLVYVVVVALVFSEAALFVGFVLPGETSVIVAGFVASRGHVNVVALCALVIAAAIVGDNVGYAVGRRYGTRLLSLSLVRSRRARVEWAMAGLRRRGWIYVFVGRFTAFLRAVVPGLAGMSRMRYREFLLANAVGAICWGIGYTLLGYFAGTALNSIERDSGWVGLGVLVGVLAVLAGIFIVKRRAEAKLTSGNEPDDDSAKGVE